MASVPVYSTLSPNVTPYVFTLNAIANLKCMASGGVCSLTFTKEVRSQRAWFLDPLQSVGKDFNGLDLRWGAGSGIGYAL